MLYGSITSPRLLSICFFLAVSHLFQSFCFLCAGPLSVGSNSCLKLLARSCSRSESSETLTPLCSQSWPSSSKKSACVPALLIGVGSLDGVGLLDGVGSLDGAVLVLILAAVIGSVLMADSCLDGGSRLAILAADLLLLVGGSRLAVLAADSYVVGRSSRLTPGRKMYK